MPERPLDCSECKKTLSICYSEVVNKKITRVFMCADCPHLEKQLYGKSKTPNEASSDSNASMLTCGNCGTSLEAIRRGNPLGCAECYSVFGDTLVDMLEKAKAISRHLSLNQQGQSLHIGRKPGEVTEVSPTLRLIALNEALDETLIREDYEQAAFLRDQIKALKQEGKDA